jgi:hypothetical protein
MLVNNEKFSLGAPKPDAGDNLAKPSVNSSKSDAKAAEVGLSSQGQNLNYLYQRSLSAAKQNPSPVYISVEKRVELLADSVNKIAGQSGYEYTPEQIKRVVEDVAKESNIKELARGDVNANSGSVYAFLSSTDKANLADAYQHALDNNTSLDDVRFAAFSLARTRFIEAKISSGTTWAVYDPDKNAGTIKSEDVEQAVHDEVPVRAESDYVKSLLEQLKKDELFMSNPFLRMSLLQDVASSQLLNNVPSLLKDKITEIG